MKRYAIVFSAILAVLALAQCSKRSNPTDISQPHGMYWSLFFESNAIKNDKMQDFWFRNILVYTPPGYDPSDTLKPIPTSIDSIHPGDTIVYGDTTGGQPPDSVIIILPDTFFVYGDTLPGTYYPVLYLLHGFGGDHTYFKGLFSVANIMDELVNSGLIQPMIVVTPNATNGLGGSFYTNSPDFGTGQSYAGRMQDFITDEVIHVVDSVYNTRSDRAHRGVAGHSMGGYGAVKLAMLRNDLFNSVSSMSGMLLFSPRGPADTSFLALMPSVWAENGFIPGSSHEDTVAFSHIAPAPTKRLTSMMFAMASAFSPHDATNLDTSYAHRFNTGRFAGYLDLPFNVAGEVVPSVWAHWLGNDVATLFADSGYGGVFDSTALYVDCGQVDQLLLQGQNSAFARVAGTYIDQFEIYPGIDNLYAADHTTLIAERLKKVFKFHSDAFPQ